MSGGATPDVRLLDRFTEIGLDDLRREARLHPDETHPAALVGLLVEEVALLRRVIHDEVGTQQSDRHIMSAAVEAAARESFSVRTGGTRTFDDLPSEAQGALRSAASDHIEAALPHLLLLPRITTEIDGETS